MADLILNKRTSLSGKEVITRAVQFFSTGRWRATSQSTRAATFQGKPPIPWFMILLTFLGFMMCLLPGIIMYLFVIKKMYGFQNIVVTATPVAASADVVVQYPKHARTLAERFLNSLP